MAKAYKFEKQQINGKWYTVCVSHEHFPMIEHCKDGRYKVTGSDGKARLEKHTSINGILFSWDKENA